MHPSKKLEIKLGTDNACRCARYGIARNLRTAESCPNCMVILPVKFPKIRYATFAAVALPAMNAKCKVKSAKCKVKTDTSEDIAS